MTHFDRSLVTLEDVTHLLDAPEAPDVYSDRVLLVNKAREYMAHKLVSTLPDPTPDQEQAWNRCVDILEMLAKDLATVQGRRLQEGDLVVDLRNLRRGSVKRLILEEGKVQIQWGENGPTSTTVSTYLKAIDSENG